MTESEMVWFPPAHSTQCPVQGHVQLVSCVTPTCLTVLCDLNTYMGHVLALKSPHLILKSHLIHTWLFLIYLEQVKESVQRGYGTCLRST